MIKYIIIFYMIFISVIGWALPAADKKRAQNGSWRIRERTLFLIAALGGSAAMYVSMKLHRHKTKHKRFMIGLPCIMAAQLASIAFAILKFKEII